LPPDIARRATLALLIALPLAPALAAAPVADPLLQKLIAGAKAVPASSIRFERVSKNSGREKDGPVETEVRVDRWDGRQMTRISINGRPATADEVEKARKASSSVPGYHRVAEFLAGGARRTAEAPGQLTYHLDRLPKGSIAMGGDRSDKFAGDVTVDTSGAQPFVSRMHFYAPKPFSIMFVAKVDRFDVVNDYRLGPDGRPMLVRQVQSISGAQFGKVGETRTESTFTPLR
jgi:hypothetical protein